MMAGVMAASNVVAAANGLPLALSCCVELGLLTYVGELLSLAQRAARIEPDHGCSE